MRIHVPARALIAGALALILTGGAALWAVHGAVWRWAEKDVTLRAELAVASARSALARRWNDAQLKDRLQDIARDERIVAVAACAADGTRIASTGGFPDNVGCIGPSVPVGVRTTPEGMLWTKVEARGGRTWHIAAIPVASETNGGFVILVHDLGFAARREAVAIEFLVGLFLLAALGAWTLSRVVGRAADRYSADRFRRALGSGIFPADLRAVVEDVRAEVEERSGDAASDVWSRSRLRKALSTPVRNRELVIVTKRAPPSEGSRGDRVTSLFETVVIAVSGIWVTLGESGSAIQSRNRSSPDGSYRAKYVGMPRSMARGQERFAANGIGRLCASSGGPPSFTGGHFSSYADANQRFAEAVCEAVHTDDPVVLVDGCAFMLVPRALRDRLPRATVIVLWGLPWPTAEAFDACPQAKSLLQSLVSATVVSVSSGTDRENFVDTVERLTRAIPDGRHEALMLPAGRSLVRSYRVPMEWSFPSPVPPWRSEEARAAVFRALGVRATDVLLGIQIDASLSSNRVDSTLLAVERLLERFPEFRGRFVLAVLTPPGTANRGESLALAARLNERFGSIQPPIILSTAPSELARRLRYYRAADLCWVSAPSTGIDAIAREFLLSRDDEQGVLVLGRFAEDGPVCPGSLPVSPYDPEQTSEMIAMALRMSPEERRARMRAARSHAAESSAFRWFGAMLSDVFGGAPGEGSAIPAPIAFDFASVVSVEKGAGRRVQ